MAGRRWFDRSCFAVLLFLQAAFAQRTSPAAELAAGNFSQFMIDRDRLRELCDLPPSERELPSWQMQYNIVEIQAPPQDELIAAESVLDQRIADPPSTEFRSADASQTTTPQRRASTPFRGLSDTLIDTITHSVLPGVESELRRDLESAQLSSSLQARSEELPLVVGTPNERGAPAFISSDVASEAENAPKSASSLAVFFAKPTEESLRRLPVAVAMEEVTRSVKQQFQLSDAQVARDLPEVDLSATQLGEMLRRSMEEVVVAEIHVELAADGLPSHGPSTGSVAPEWKPPVSERVRRQAPQQQARQCRLRRFRSVDGRCNNLQQPQLGAAFTPFKRYISQVHYADGVRAPRVNSYSRVRRRALPSARLVSMIMHHDLGRTHDHVTAMLAQWGQFLDHDISHTPVSAVRTPQGRVVTPTCCNLPPGLRPHRECFAIPVPTNDPFYAPFRQNCLEFVRSSPATRRLGPREQMNQLSSFLDASVVYGSTQQESNNLRLFRAGLLRSAFNPRAREEKLPGDPQSGECVGSVPARGRVCFRAGDVRCNEQTALAAMHTVMMREHNRIARTLQRHNGHWADERLYQETRKIIGAIMQHITYNEWLPVVLGRDAVERFGLQLESSGYYNGYDVQRSPAIANVFATAAFRFGHSLVQGRILLMSQNHSRVGSQNLVGSFFSPLILHDDRRTDQVIRGLIDQNVQIFDRHVDTQLTDHLFQTPGLSFGHDLAARNIQRGRDHGLPGYTFWRQFCGLPQIAQWDDLAGEMPTDAIARLRNLYDNPNDVDLFTAGTSEFSAPGALVGPTFACLIGQQFQDLRKGDRFWYENRGNGAALEGFRPEQLQEIRKASMARVICDTTDTETIQRNVMLETIGQMSINPRLHCSLVAGPDLAQWIERPRGVGRQTGLPTPVRRRPPPPRQPPTRRPPPGFQQQRGNNNNGVRPPPNNRRPVFRSAAPNPAFRSVNNPQLRLDTSPSETTVDVVGSDALGFGPVLVGASTNSLARRVDSLASPLVVDSVLMRRQLLLERRRRLLALLEHG